MPPADSFIQRVKSFIRFLSKVPGKLFIVLLLAYRYFLSPLFPPACRFEPTCSRYAIEAVKKYGALRGGALALWRILRCHPFSKGGYDPVR